jgi:hypothetical protein
MKTIIKRVLKEDNNEEFIKNRNQMYKRIEKLTPKIVEYFSKVLKEYDIFDISVEEVKTSYGSTFVRDEYGVQRPYSGNTKRITFTFTKLTTGETSDVRKIVFNDVENLFGIPVKRYGTPLDLKFFNLVQKEF